jgi:hypothetical protein
LFGRFFAGSAWIFRPFWQMPDSFLVWDFSSSLCAKKKKKIGEEPKTNIKEKLYEEKFF